MFKKEQCLSGKTSNCAANSFSIKKILRTNDTTSDFSSNSFELCLESEAENSSSIIQSNQSINTVININNSMIPNDVYIKYVNLRYVVNKYKFNSVNVRALALLALPPLKND